MGYVDTLYKSALRPREEYDGVVISYVDGMDITAKVISDPEKVYRPGKQLSINPNEVKCGKKCYHLFNATATVTVDDGAYYDLFGGNQLRAMGLTVHNQPHYEIHQLADDVKEGRAQKLTDLIVPQGYIIILSFGYHIRVSFWVSGEPIEGTFHSAQPFERKVEEAFKDFGLPVRVSAITRVKKYGAAGDGWIRYSGYSVLMSEQAQDIAEGGMWKMQNPGE